MTRPKVSEHASHATAESGRVIRKVPPCILLALVLSVTIAQSREARDAAVRPVRIVPEGAYDPFEIDQGLRGRFTEAHVDTYCIVWYDFEQMNWQGWTRFDNTAQIDTFFHVDDFSGLGGGAYGCLHPIEGTRSMWCGMSLCGWRMT
jgi:hypothetical protein